MSLLDNMPMDELFAYDPSRAGDSVDGVNQAEQDCARAIVEQELTLHLDRVKIPAELLPLFQDAWKEVLTAIYIEDGFGSIRWMLAMEITDELLWTLQPKANMAERTKMIGMLPILIKVLRQGLNSVHWDRKSADSMFSSLSHYHMSVLSSAKQAQPAAEPVQAKAPQASHDIELLEGIEFDGLPLDSQHGGEKGWVFRADTHEWVYQEGDEPADSSMSTKSTVRKLGRGDH